MPGPDRNPRWNGAIPGAAIGGLCWLGLLGLSMLLNRYQGAPMRLGELIITPGALLSWPLVERFPNGWAPTCFVLGIPMVIWCLAGAGVGYALRRRRLRITPNPVARGH